MMSAKKIHDAYGKKVLWEAFGSSFNSSPDTVSFGEKAGKLKIDGTIDQDIAVEIESRVSKQVRGAIIDIICHPFPRKLLILIKKHGNDYTENQCRELLKRFAPLAPASVVTLKGSGTDDKTCEDAELIKCVVKILKNIQSSSSNQPETRKNLQ